MELEIRRGVKVQKRNYYSELVIAQTFAAKVQMQLDSGPKQLVRNVETERRRRLYASFDLHQLLLDRGVNSQKDVLKTHWLSLEIFDDQEFDCRTPAEWLDLGLVQDKRHPVPGEALLASDQGESHWQAVAVVDYCESSGLWHLLTLDGNLKSHQVPRLRLRFYAEDPRVFANRLASAVLERERVAMEVRYSLFLDCAPTEGIESLSSAAMEAILQLTDRNGTLSQTQRATMIKEIERNYQRVMCELQCGECLSNQLFGTSVPTQQFALKPKAAAPISRWRNYGETREYLEWNSLFAQSEVYEVVLAIVGECDKVSRMHLFSVKTAGSKAASLEDFEAQQLYNLHSTVNHLKQQWLEKVAQSVRMCLRDVGKGWFDLEQRNHYVYDVAKLHRLSRLIRQRMQNALRVLVIKSASEYLAILEAPTVCVPKLDDSFDWGLDLKSTRFQSAANAIFEIELAMNDREAFYTTELRLFEAKLDSLLVNALQLCQQIKQVHTLLLKNLKFAKSLYIDCVNVEEESVRRVREKIQASYRKCLTPLGAFVRKFDKYRDNYVLDVAAYARNFEAEEHPVHELKEEIQSRYRFKSQLANEIPSSANIGPFRVNIERLRKSLLSKQDDMVTRLLEGHSSRLKAQIEDALDEFRIVQLRLNAEPANVEQLFEIREWMESVPLRVAERYEGLQKLKIEYDLLDAFRWNLTEEDFQAKWEAFKFPGRIQALMEETYEKLKSLEKETFYKLQLEDESAIGEKIESLVGAVTNIVMQKDVKKVHEIAAEVRRTWKTIEETQELGILLNSRQKLFKVRVKPFEELAKLVKEFDPYKSFWLTASDWLKYYEIWMLKPLVNIEGGEIENMVGDMYKTMLKCIKTFQDQPAIHQLANELKSQMEEFKPYVSCIQALRNPGMKERHLDELSDRIGIKIALTTDLTFQSLLALGIMEHKEAVKEVSESAAKEHAIEEALLKMTSDWETLTMEVIAYKDTGTYMMKVADETQLLLDDHAMSTQQLSFSPFKAAFEEEIDEWWAKLKLAQQVLGLWMEVQKIWMYLEPIFSSEDISRQLPMEAKKYSTMERNWRRIMRLASDNPVIIEICPDRTLLESLRECMTLLEVVQKGLSDYLESRRMIFPRFFFLSDDELLEILAQAKNVHAVQPHLKKCFESIKELRFESDLRITRMYSAEGEEVILRPSVLPEGSVEHWLGAVESSMRSSVRHEVSKSLESVEKLPRRDWVFRWPGQVSLCVGQASWTGHVERAIAAGKLQEYFKVMMSQLDDLRELVRNPSSEIQRMMLEAIITIEVHARDVLAKLVEEAVSSVNDFDWISQLRYYWVDDDLKVRAVNAEFQYGYEYLGNNGRLVITPLTDRCYLTLTGALHLKFGGAPAGPAGTGKTETTKDLAKAFAIQCVVFNCSDQLDFMSMGKFFKGLASSGAWACFDEFNRIDVEVLSVIAQQLMTIQKAQQLGVDRFVFEGVELSLRASCAAFITMNPGYAGRTELPDNLKALFRPVAMMVPNYTLIAEISLFSCGFVQAKSLAGKITATFKLSSEQLSSQDHYDFGMRSVKTVIAVAGILKREQKDMQEEQICLRALRDVNVPKFLKDDLKLFNGIVSDLFPGVQEKSINYEVLLNAIRETIKDMDLADVKEFVHKIIQLYETTIVRHGLMLVGPTGSGKTKCYQVLKEACTRLKGQAQPSGKPFVPVHTYVLNPKSITMGQLYGEFDLNTHEWTDGILSTLIRAGTAATDEDKRWYVFDGPVDAVWIENMNTVLDDNKKLCLSSGEIMRLSPNQTMMFEVADLRVASPATVSRCGMVYLQPAGLGIEPFIDCWAAKLPESVSGRLSELAYSLVLPGLKLVRERLREIVRTVNACLLQSYTHLVSLQLNALKLAEDEPFPMELLEPWSVYALIWSLGATCDAPDRRIFSDWLRALQREAGHALPLPAEGVAHDYRLEMVEDQVRWAMWTDLLPEVTFAAEKRFADMEVPTVDMLRASALIEQLLTSERNVLCVGPTGSGKSLTVAVKLSREMPAKFICDSLVFSARTSANQTQDLVDGKLDKRRRGVYGPPLAKRQVFFVDDLNMPALETYGAQPPIELLRQFMDFRGWYDRKEIGDFRRIEDVVFIGAMAPPGGGRNPVTARLLRHFHMIAFPDMEDETKRRIFGTIFGSWLSRTADLADLLEPLLSATLQLFSRVSDELLPTPEKSHYTFNARDLGKVFQGILMADPSKTSTRDELLLLWGHESSRVFSDRLINAVDRSCFERLLRQSLETHLGCDLPLELDGLFYGDFCNHEGRYERIREVRQMLKSLQELLEDYNAASSVPMNLVLFQDAMGHVCRISRLLRQSPGNALLLGMGGSGRQSLTKLSAHICEYSCFQIELSQTYGAREWRDDVKELLLRTGLKQRPSVFLFSDTQIKNELFLEDINNLLSSGDIPNIYQADELDRIFQAMRGPLQQSGLQINRSNLLAAYQKLVRNNLHTVLAMCPVGEQFRARIRQFPALVSLCTINWFEAWPESALQSVALHFLEDVKDAAISDTVLRSIVRVCQFMHSSVITASERLLQEHNRQNYVTPTSYLELISSYGDLLEKKRQSLATGIARLSTGLEKLAITEVEVKEMQLLLEKMKPELEQAAQVSARMMVVIGRDTEEAEKARAAAAEQEREATKLKRENQAIRDEAEADLSTARPMLAAAEASLKALNKGDITEVKAMKRPPVGVVMVIEAICIVKGVKPLKVAGERPGEKLNDYWTPGSQLLADAGHFLASLENFNKEELTEDAIRKLKGYVESPDFQPKKVQQASKACHSLCLWVHAIYNWYFVNLRVAPKMAALQAAEQALQRTEATLAAANARLGEVQAGLDKLQQQLRREEAHRADLERQRQLCEERMSRAIRLISGLAGEQVRWLASVADLRRGLTCVVGDVLLSAGAIAYLTPFTDSYRKQLLDSWLELMGQVPHSPGCSPVVVLGDPVLIRRWQMDGLPRDALSVENAVLVSNSRRWPLFVDPQAQANRWIRNMSGSGLSVVRMTDRELLRVVESCVRFGRACLVENVALELEAALDPVLMRSLFRQAGQLCIKIGDNVVPYNSDFRLYLTTKLPNPHYAPEIAVKVLLVNFSLTQSGLEDQMLSLVVMQERPELEETRSALVVSSAQMKRELKEIEDRILYRLSLSEGSAVDDVDLILTLEASKIKSEEIKVKVEAAEATQVDIDSARSLYIPVAERAQILFFCLLDLQQVDTMYQYSLEWFVRIFTGAMMSTEQSEDVAVRVKNINEYLTFSLFSNVCRSLFERHKLHFAFLLCARIRMTEGLIDPAEWRFLLSGAIPPKEVPNPAPEWLTQRCWIEIQSLQVLAKFRDLVPSFKASLPAFKTVFDSLQPEKGPYPAPWASDLDDLQKLLLLKCLRPDKVMNAMQLYIGRFLGRRFIEPQAAGLEALYSESSPTTPLIFVLSSGTDPASELYKFAEKLRMARKLFPISLGQGQGPRAELMLKQSIEAGNWLFFQNCHLAPSWMPRLESLVERLPPDTAHRDFRLWLTSMPSPVFPVSILQNGSKMTMEPPRGVKANMLRAYASQLVESMPLLEATAEEEPKSRTFRALVFSLCLFHAVLLERRKFGPLGFNIPYEFTDGDLAICVSQLRMFLLEYLRTPFKVLVYTAGHINYGGRITDDWDRRCVLTLLASFYDGEALRAGHRFDSQGLYQQPPLDSSYAGYLELIKSLPINDDPDLFGLHANANISYAQTETYACLSTLLAMQPREVGGAVAGLDQVTSELAQAILSQLPDLFDLADIQREYPVSYEESLNTVLLQEAARYNGLLLEMSTSLRDLLRALKGLVVMSDKLEAMAASMYVNRVPENWSSKGFASLKPLGAWAEELRRRLRFLRRWQDHGIPASFWISGFYFPQAFLTGTLQNYARKHGLSIDSIDFDFRVLAERPQVRPDDGCVVYGLFLEGCRWDGRSLAESLPKELYTDMPPVLLLPGSAAQLPSEDQATYECPVYKTVVRAGTLSTTGHSTNFVLSMRVPSDRPPRHWVVRGVALVCSLDF